MLLFSHSVVSNSLWSHGLQHSRLPCLSPSPGICSCLLSQWCYLTISSSSTLFSFCHQSFPASGSFPMSQLFASGGWSIGAFSFSIRASNEYSGLIVFRTHSFDLPAVQGTLKSLLQHHSLKASVLWCSAFSIVQGKGTTEQLYGALRTTLKDTDKFKVSGCRQHETLIVSIWRLKCLH